MPASSTCARGSVLVEGLEGTPPLGSTQDRPSGLALAMSLGGGLASCSGLSSRVVSSFSVMLHVSKLHQNRRQPECGLRPVFKYLLAKKPTRMFKSVGHMLSSNKWGFKNT